MSSTFTQFDHQMMARALGLAKRGRFTTSPNPNVGCVITKGDRIVGEGFHYQAGEPHAEVHALRQAGEQAEGATAYVTLEPCSHYGRTPPCAEGLIKAKVARVICAMQDPNPQVAGRGIEMLKQAGIEVSVGLMQTEAQQLNRGFIKRMQSAMPFVQLKMASSLDGKTALANGQSQWITAVDARRDVQQFRAQASAILSTAQTVIDDDASLNVRESELSKEVLAVMDREQPRQPLRIILDAKDRLTPSLKLFNTPGEVVVIGSEIATSNQLLDADGKFELKTTLAYLANEHSINDLWVEAGATLAGSFIEKQLVDELILYLAPKLMGADGRSLAAFSGLTQMSQVPQLTINDVRSVGDDLRLRCSFAATFQTTK